MRCWVDYLVEDNTSYLSLIMWSILYYLIEDRMTHLFCYGLFFVIPTPPPPPPQTHTHFICCNNTRYLVPPVMLVNQYRIILGKQSSCCACAMQHMRDFFFFCKAHIGGQPQKSIHDELGGFLLAATCPTYKATSDHNLNCQCLLKCWLWGHTYHVLLHCFWTLDY